jgi:hypothetical protein
LKDIESNTVGGVWAGKNIVVPLVRFSRAITLATTSLEICKVLGGLTPSGLGFFK